MAVVVDDAFVLSGNKNDGRAFVCVLPLAIWQFLFIVLLLGLTKKRKKRCKASQKFCELLYSQALI